MAKFNRKNVVLIRSMFERAKKRRRMIESALHTLLIRRIRVLQVSMFVVLILLSGKNTFSPLPRSCCRLARNSGWWNLVWRTYSAARFKKTFRVSCETFSFILSRIRHVLDRKSIVEVPICPELRLAVCLYRLGRGSLLYYCGDDRSWSINCLHHNGGGL
ncbi:Hypothetical predicted protein [Paramuricea clavata]|uniref:Uncharacterized protein n=1 Tax=Paramuricea clavata TaxID=317549 RepID=A0A6S7K105_PARCT|nr:Hypothetical predicted protein [Paramuricea clavata]